MVLEFKRLDVQFASTTGLSGWPRACAVTQPSAGSGQSFIFNDTDKTWDVVTSPTTNWWTDADYYITLAEYSKIPGFYYGWFTLTPSSTTLSNVTILCQSAPSSPPVAVRTVNIYNGYPVTDELREFWWDQTHAQLTATDGNMVYDAASNTLTTTTHLGDTIVTNGDRTSD